MTNPIDHNQAKLSITRINEENCIVSPKKNSTSPHMTTSKLLKHTRTSLVLTRRCKDNNCPNTRISKENDNRELRYVQFLQYMYSFKLIVLITYEIWTPRVCSLESSPKLSCEGEESTLIWNPEARNKQSMRIAM